MTQPRKSLSSLAPPKGGSAREEPLPASEPSRPAGGVPGRRSRRAVPKVVFTLRLSAETHEGLGAIADHQGRSMQDLIEEAVSQWLARQGRRRVGDRQDE